MKELTTMSKQLFVASEVQATLLTTLLIPEMADGFWKNHRPVDHASQWKDVQIIVSSDNTLGPVNFKIPRLYNFVNPDFIKPNEARLVAAAQTVKPASNFRSVKKELIELSRIVGGRLTDKDGTPTKANRGNNKSTTDLVNDGKAAVKKAVTAVKKTAVKKTDSNVTVTKTSSGATVRRVAVTHAIPATVETE